MREQKKRVSKWDMPGPSDPPADHQSADTNSKLEHTSTNSKWDKPPADNGCDKVPAVESKWDKFPASDSKWDKKPTSSTADGTNAAAGGAAGTNHAAGSAAGTGGLVAAAEAAARVNAMLMAKGSLKPAEPLLVNENILKAKSVALQPAGNNNNAVTSDIEINDVPSARRNLLTLSVTQDDILRSTGASVATKGRYMTEDEKSQADSSDRALYLHVSGPTQAAVDKAVARIRDVMSGTSDRQRKADRRKAAAAAAARMAPQPLMSLNTSGLAYVQEKLFIGLEHAPPSFDVRNRVIGPGGCYLVHIQMETGAKVMLRGKGSDFMEPTSGREAFEPMYIYIQHPTVHGLQQAKQLALNLIDTVHQDYSSFQQTLAALPPTVSPGTANLLAGYQQQSSVYNPYSSSLMYTPYNSMPAAPQTGLPQTGSVVGMDVSTPWSSLPQYNATPNASNFSLDSMTSSTHITSAGLPFLPGTSATGFLPSTLPLPSSIPLPGTSPFLPPPPPPPPVSVPSVVQSLPTFIPNPLSSLPLPSSAHPTSSTPPTSSTSCCVSTAATEVTDSSKLKTDLSKRRFTEEKQEEEETTDNLLGYQHGPLHLSNTLPGSNGHQPTVPSVATVTGTTVSTMTGTTTVSTNDDIYDPFSADDDIDDSITTTTTTTVTVLPTTTRLAECCDKELMPPPPPVLTTTTAAASDDLFVTPLPPTVTQHVSGFSKTSRKHKILSEQPSSVKREKLFVEPVAEKKKLSEQPSSVKREKLFVEPVAEKKKLSEQPSSIKREKLFVEPVAEKKKLSKQPSSTKREKLFVEPVADREKLLEQPSRTKREIEPVAEKEKLSEQPSPAKKLKGALFSVAMSYNSEDDSDGD